jgi:DNA gyrase inhibitor GyrI
MNLTEEPDVVTWPRTHYVFVEKIGSFRQTAPQAWQELHQRASRISESNEITGYLSLYKMSPNTYRAGVSLAAAPNDLPEDLEYMVFEGGKYSRFVLTGPYSDLPEASGRVFEIVSRTEIEMRIDYCIEHYVNDPKNTPEAELVTEILIPTA